MTPQENPMNSLIDENRLARVMDAPLSEGEHEPPNGEFAACVMEAAAYIANEPWSDRPECVCPAITSFMIVWNDGLPGDHDRDRLLKPLLPRVIGTRDPALIERRGYMALDWLIRVYTAEWLDLVDSLKPHAASLKGLSEITDLAGATAAGTMVRAAGAAAWDAAWDAAGDAAGDAARDAAGDAARAAAGDALRPTVQKLQQSASDLVIRMCEAS